MQRLLRIKDNGRRKRIREEKKGRGTRRKMKIRGAMVAAPLQLPPPGCAQEVVTIGARPAAAKTHIFATIHQFG